MLRRDFLKLTTIATAGVFVPQFGRWYRQEVPPRLWGDGWHDDTAALQWRMDKASRDSTRFVLQGGVYRVNQTLVLRNEFTLDGAVFRGERCSGPIVRVDATQRPLYGCVMMNCAMYGSVRGAA